MMDRPIGIPELQKMVADRNFVFIASQLFPARPGVMLFSTILEYRHYKPTTPRNDDFIPIQVQWPEDEDPAFKMIWWVMRIPAKDFAIAQKVAAESPIPMRIADGIPHIVGPNGLQKFPLDGPNVFVLENASGSEIYQAGGVQRMMEKQKVELDKLYKEQDQWLRDNGKIQPGEDVWTGKPEEIIGTTALLVFARPNSHQPEDPGQAEIRMVLLGDYERCRQFYREYIDKVEPPAKPDLDKFLAYLGDQRGFRSPTKEELTLWQSSTDSRHPMRVIPWLDEVGSLDAHWAQFNMRRKK